jgi:hypothetical protein
MGGLGRWDFCDSLHFSAFVSRFKWPSWRFKLEDKVAAAIEKLRAEKEAENTADQE